MHTWATMSSLYTVAQASIPPHTMHESTPMSGGQHKPLASRTPSQQTPVASTNCGTRNTASDRGENTGRDGRELVSGTHDSKREDELVTDMIMTTENHQRRQRGRDEHDITSCFMSPMQQATNTHAHLRHAMAYTAGIQQRRG